MLPISVIISVYNAERYLSESLDSVLNQSMPAKEIIVINDGSTDQTINILKSYGKKIKLIDRENKGVPYSVNEGLSEVKQPWIAFNDGDDIWSQNKLELQYNYLLEHKDLRILFGMMRQFISPELSEEDKASIYVPNSPEKALIRPAMLAHQSVFEDYGLFNPTLKAGDFIEWFQKIKENDLKFDFIDEVIYCRRLHKNSLSNKEGVKDDFLKILKAKLDRAKTQSF
jgi:glycosyltransferase involved in cell wall biosynthesis